MRHPDITIWTAPPPAAVSQCTVQVVGPPGGTATYFYWLVAHYPIGSVVSQPFIVRGAPKPTDAANAVVVSWTPVKARDAVITYDLLRTDSDQLPADPSTPLALATGLTQTIFFDQGETLQPYDVAGLIHGAPTDGWAYLNNANYSEPVLELYPTIRVNKIVFPDGSEQSTSGGANFVEGPGISIIELPGGELQISAVPAGAQGQIQFNDGGAFGASGNLTWDDANSVLTVTGEIQNPSRVLSDGSFGAGLKVTSSTQGVNGYGIGCGTNYQLTFGASINVTGGTPQMVLQSHPSYAPAGHLGLNTLDPALYTLDVVGDIPNIARFSNSSLQAVATITNDGVTVNGNIVTNGSVFAGSASDAVGQGINFVTDQGGYYIAGLGSAAGNVLQIGSLVTSAALLTVDVIGNAVASGNFTLGYSDAFGGVTRTIAFANNASTALDKRIAAIQSASTNALLDSGYLSFQTASAGVLSEKMRIDQFGNTTISLSNGQILLEAYRDNINGSTLTIGGALGAGSTESVSAKILLRTSFAGFGYYMGINMGNGFPTNALAIGAGGSGSSGVLQLGTSILGMSLVVYGYITAPLLPTSSAGLQPGDIWNNGGVLNIV